MCFHEQEFVKVPEQQCSSRTGTASIRAVAVWKAWDFNNHIVCKPSTPQAVFPVQLSSLICSGTENMIFVHPPLCCRFDTFMAVQVREKSIELFQVGPTFLESHEKIKSVPLNLKKLIWCAFEFWLLINRKKCDLCARYFLGRVVLQSYPRLVVLFRCSAPVLINH